MSTINSIVNAKTLRSYYQYSTELSAMIKGLGLWRLTPLSTIFQLYTVNREILVMVLFWPFLALKYEVPKLNTPKYVTLQKLTAKI